MAIHSTTGFCIACGAAYCMKRGEIEHMQSELYKKTNVIYGGSSVDFDFLKSTYERTIKPDNLYLPRFLSNNNEDKCSCGTGYNMLCPVHGILKR